MRARPFPCPVRAPSRNRTSTGVSAGRPALCAASALARFFESPDHPTVPGRVPRTPWDVGKARLNRTVRHHALRTCHAETFIDDPNRIDAPPAHHTIALPARFRQSAPVPASAGRPTARGGLHPRGWSTHRDPLCQTDAPGPPMSGGPFRQSAPPPFGSCHRRQQSMPEVVVSGGCLNIAAQDGASWKHQNHGEGVQQQAWQICFAGVNHKSMKGEFRLSQNSMRLVLAVQLWLFGYRSHHPFPTAAAIASCRSSTVRKISGPSE